MTGRTGTARAALATVLTPVLPGRVYAYPPARPSPTAPAMWVAEFEQGWGEVDDVWVATFVVRLVADGADHAAAAALDDLVDAAYDAVAASAEFYPDAVRFDPFDVDATTVLPSYVFGVRAELTALSWCPPAPPAAVTIPTPPVTVT